MYCTDGRTWPTKRMVSTCRISRAMANKRPFWPWWSRVATQPATANWTPHRKRKMAKWARRTSCSKCIDRTLVCNSAPSRWPKSSRNTKRCRATRPRHIGRINMMHRSIRARMRTGAATAETFPWDKSVKYKKHGFPQAKSIPTFPSQSTMLRSIWCFTDAFFLSFLLFHFCIAPAIGGLASTNIHRVVWLRVGRVVACRNHTIRSRWHQQQNASDSSKNNRRTQNCRHTDPEELRRYVGQRFEIRCTACGRTIVRKTLEENKMIK